MRSSKRTSRARSGRRRQTFLPSGRTPRNIGALSSLSSNNSVYPRMIKLDFLIPITSLAVATGSLATALAINPTVFNTPAITNALALFDEYCVVGATFEIRVICTANPSGVIYAIIDEKQGAAPVYATVESKPHVELLIQNDIDKKYVIKWKAADYLDLQWSATTATTSNAYLKIYAGAATGTTGATSAQVTITGALSLCFRGYS